MIINIYAPNKITSKLCKTTIDKAKGGKKKPKIMAPYFILFYYCIIFYFF